MVLLDDIIEILDLANLDRRVPIIIDPIDGCLVSSTFVRRDLLRITAMAPALSKNRLAAVVSQNFS